VFFLKCTVFLEKGTMQVKQCTAETGKDLVLALKKTAKVRESIDKVQFGLVKMLKD
jgi:hypothetical protein